MSADGDRDDDDDAATIIATAEAIRDPVLAKKVESETKPMSSPFAAETRAMPAGYGARLIAAQPPPNVPRPAAGRPVAPGRPDVPVAIEDADSVTDLTLVELIDAELESATAVFVPPQLDFDSGEEISMDSEATVRLAVPDDIPADILERPSKTGVTGPLPSFSSLPTPPLTAAPVGAPLVVEPLVLGPPSEAEHPVVAPAPGYVARYLVVCFVASLLGAIVLVLLKSQRYW